jgi:hypothetical protein
MMHNKNISFLQEKAIEYTQFMGFETFHVSSSCVDKLKKYHGMIIKILSRESYSISEEDYCF